MNPEHPELFTQRPVRSDFGRSPSYRTRRILTVLILLLVLGGAGRWAYGLFSSSHPGEIPTIKADNTAWKQKPEQPGGLDIPHQDVEVYQALDNKDASKPEVEHLLPPPEVPQTQAMPAANTAANSVVPSPVSVPPASAPQAESLMPPALAINEASALSAAPPVATTVESQPAKAPVVPTTVQPVKPAAAAPAPQAEKKKPVISGKANRVIQLASVQDETIAKDMMGRLQRRYASILDEAQLRVVQADLGEKGIYYRIQSQPISDERANKICASVKKLKAGCILVRK